MLIAPRVHAAVFHWPSLGAWGYAIVLLGIYAAIAVPWGVRSSLLRWQPVGSPEAIGKTLILSFFLPALLEELLFRVWLLPNPTDPYFYTWAIGGLFLFILAHPLNAIVFLPHRKPTFFDRHFLTLAGLLGVICTLSYQQSGSLWTPVVLHWIIVVVWLLFWGGLERMTSPPASTTAPPSVE